MEIEYSEIKDLKINYILHLAINAIIIIFNFSTINQIVWLQKSLHYLFLFGSFFDILFFILPIISLFFFIFQKFNKKNILFFRHLSILFCILALMFGLYFSIILLLTTIDSSEFYKDCPFNIPISGIINNANRCSEKICELNSEDLDRIYPYEYICSFDPTEYFDNTAAPFRRKGNNSQEIISDYQIVCEKYDYNYTFENEIIYQYLDVCNSNEEFYICQRFFEPKTYALKNNFKCPNDNYYKILYIFCIFNIIFNLIFSFIPWRAEISIYDKIIETFRTNRVSNSLKSTKFSSKILGKEEKFEKLPTELIIVCNNKTLNLNNNINIINKNEEIKIKVNKRNEKINHMTDGANSESNNRIDIINPQNSTDIFILNNNTIKKSKIRK